MNYYELLGVSNDATEEEIRSAYKREIKKWHPDINKDEEAVSITMRLNEAKETLLNKEKRIEYDNFINHKETQTYQKYTKADVNKEDVNVDINKKVNKEYNNYEDRMVTKWEYLKEFMQQKNISKFKRVTSYIFVMLETALCFIIKYLVIGLAYLCFVISDFILILLKTVAPVLLLLLIYILYMLSFKDFDVLVSNNTTEIRILFIFGILFISMFILPFLGKKLISQKVFDFLYNKLDIYLFKKAVGYKN